MDRRAFDGVCAYMAGVWGHTLSDLQRAAGWKLLEPLADTAVEQAVTWLAEQGGQHMPSWAVVAKAAREIPSTAPALPPVEREATPEEAARSLRFRAAAVGEAGELVKRAWMVFAKHATGCADCGAVATACRRPGLTSAAAVGHGGGCCNDGISLYGDWRLAVAALMAA